MPDPIEGQVTEAPAEELTPETTETETTSTEETQTTSDQPAEEISPEAKELAEGSTPGEKETSAVGEEPEKIEDYLKTPETPEEKSRVQERIDDLVKQRATLEKRLAELEKGQGKTPEYTDAQLKGALRKAISEGDADLVWEIMEYRSTRDRESLVKMYQDEQTKATQAKEMAQREWSEITTAYSRYADTKLPAIYPGSHKDLNIGDPASLLYQVAMALYSSNDPDKARIYRSGPGGQKLAVADALTAILAKKSAKRNDSKTRLLEKRLQKEKFKKSIVGAGGPGATEDKGPVRPLSDTERLDDYISERKKYQEERS